jgi:hypothetical protein
MKNNSQPKSPLSIFFSLGDKVTKTPMQKLNFDYAMMWIIFLAFGFVFVGNIFRFFTQGYELANLGWALFGLAILYFQYFNLKNIYKLREYQRNAPKIQKEDDGKIETVDEMLESFRK